MSSELWNRVSSRMTFNARPRQRSEVDETICGSPRGGPWGVPRTSLNRGECAKNSAGWDRTVRHRSRSALARQAGHFESCWAFLSPLIFACALFLVPSLLSHSVHRHSASRRRCKNCDRAVSQLVDIRVL